MDDRKIKQLFDDYAETNRKLDGILKMLGQIDNDGVRICDYDDTPCIQVFQGIHAIAEILGITKFHTRIIHCDGISDYAETSFIYKGVKILQLDSVEGAE